MMRKYAGSTVAVVLTLALGLGLNTSVFSVVNALLIRELPYPDPDRIVRITPIDESNPLAGRIAGTELVRWRSESRSLDGIAGYDTAVRTLVDPAGTIKVAAASVSPELFEMLGATAWIGRTFLPADRSARVAVLGHGVWQQRFAGRPEIVGAIIRLDGDAYQVVGVMKPGFAFPSADAALWIPLDPNPRVVAMPDGRRSLSIAQMFALGRMKGGATHEQVRTEAKTAIRSARDVRVSSLHDDLVAPVRPALIALQTAVLVIVLIVCANVANILLARGAGRAREMAIRAALGGRRRAIVRQLLVESCALSLTGAALGVLLAWWSFRALRVLNPGNLPQYASIGLDLNVLLYATGVALLVGTIAGLLPAFRFSRVDVASGLRSGGDRAGSDAPAAGWTGRVLVCAEISLALVLVTVALAMVNSFLRLVTAPRGYEVRGLAAADVTLAGERYDAVRERQIFYGRLLQSMEADPAIERAAVASELPLDAPRGYFHLQPAGDEGGTFLFVEGRATRVVNVSRDYLAVMQIPVLRGRAFTPADTDTSLPVVVLSEAAARRDFPMSDPVGRTLKFRDRDWHVIGVAADVTRDPLAGDSAPLVYVPFWQLGYAGPLWDSELTTMSVVVRARGSESGALAGIREHVRGAEPQAAIHALATMETRLYQAVGPINVYGTLMSGLAALALTLAGFGMFGLLTYAVARRTREIGIRLALGAERRVVFRALMRDGLLLAAIGTAAGLPLAIVVNQALRGVFHGVHPVSGTMLALAPVFVLSVALAACALPARAATRVDPLVALTWE